MIMDGRLQALAAQVVEEGLHGSLLNVIRRAGAYSGVLQVLVNAGGFSALSRSAGVSYQTAQKWLDQGFVPTKRVAEIAELYDVPAVDLVNPKHRNLFGASQ